MRNYADEPNGHKMFVIANLLPSNGTTKSALYGRIFQKRKSL